MNAAHLLGHDPRKPRYRAHEPEEGKGPRRRQTINECDCAGSAPGTARSTGPAQRLRLRRGLLLRTVAAAFLGPWAAASSFWRTKCGPRGRGPAGPVCVCVSGHHPALPASPRGRRSQEQLPSCWGECRAMGALSRQAQLG